MICNPVTLEMSFCLIQTNTRTFDGLLLGGNSDFASAFHVEVVRSDLVTKMVYCTESTCRKQGQWVNAVTG